MIPSTAVRRVLALTLLILAATCRSASVPTEHWTAAWFTSEQLTEPHNMPPAPGLSHSTLRQFIMPTLSGSSLRLTLSNAFGHSPLVVKSVHIAVAADGSGIDVATDHEVRFHGEPGLVLQSGAEWVSDPVAMPVKGLQRLAVTMAIEEAPPAATGHPGSRTGSYFGPGDTVVAAQLTGATRVEHWYFITSLEVTSDPHSAAVVALGDSITDGRGTTTDANNRWTDNLARRLQANPATASIAVLNAGIGGNCLLRGGLGPNALARFDRDVLAPAGVKWLIVFEGINDIGARHGAKPGDTYMRAADIIAAYEQLILRAHAHGLRVVGATITPYEGADFYFTADGEADRQSVNEWIRHSGKFDAVADFDAALRDPKAPTHLAAAFDSGDHLHPGPKGYEAIANAIDLSLFSASR